VIRYKKKDGSADLRYTENRIRFNGGRGINKDGSADMRFKANRKKAGLIPESETESD
jgi:hypothetical protein